MKYRDLVQLLSNNGFVQLRRANGSHVIWQRQDQRIVVVEHHNREVSRAVVMKIQKMCKR